ncbi:MAG: hypothetical protein ABI443_05275 [Chthoniobacterales bacterium]
MSDFHKYSEPEEVEELDLSTEELDTQVHKAQEQLLELRRRQEQIEKEKQKLEELSRKQDELDLGRGDMVDKFNRALAVIQREAAEAQKRTEQLQSIYDAFQSHLRELESINVKSLSGAELPRELSRGLSSVDEARSDFEKLYPKVSVEDAIDTAYAASASEYEESYGGDKSFASWFMMGLAFTLPVIILGVIALLVLVWHLSSH